MRISKQSEDRLSGLQYRRDLQSGRVEHREQRMTSSGPWNGSGLVRRRHDPLALVRVLRKRRPDPARQTVPMRREFRVLLSGESQLAGVDVICLHDLQYVLG